ncbi:MAG: hypothetical protein ACOC5T_09030, partial [Elusimicrobiota bacterium]
DVELGMDTLRYSDGFIMRVCKKVSSNQKETILLGNYITLDMFLHSCENLSDEYIFQLSAEMALDQKNKKD